MTSSEKGSEVKYQLSPAVRGQSNLGDSDIQRTEWDKENTLPQIYGLASYSQTYLGLP